MRVYRPPHIHTGRIICSLTIREGISEIKKRKRNLHNVPSLYVRVYRHKIKRMVLRPGSLTIREGISWWHYSFKPTGLVPSLYVRVYRLYFFESVGVRRSLTIREGISYSSIDFTSFKLFPHYTWGYIGWGRRNKDGRKVPSLYVRVYLLMIISRISHISSLTIREGISCFVSTNGHTFKFPHYTWGYIVLLEVAVVPLYVPSLYVRVYRTEP